MPLTSAVPLHDSDATSSSQAKTPLRRSTAYIRNRTRQHQPTTPESPTLYIQRNQRQALRQEPVILDQVTQYNPGESGLCYPAALARC